MEAKFDHVVNNNRSRLEEVLPLETPYSLFIDVCNACNFRCGFCAIQSSKTELRFQKQRMEKALFKKIIDDLCEFPEPLKMLRLAANGEPLLNRDLPWMIAYAKEKAVSNWIEIVSNGSKLNPKLNRELVAAGLNRIRISIEGIDASAYEDMAGVRLDWEEFLENIKDLYDNRGSCEIYIKTVDAAVDSEEKKRVFLETFGDRADKVFIEHVVPVWADYKKIYDDFQIEKKEGLHGHQIRDVLICPTPFYSFVINPDGQATACCSDWKRDLIIGDVTKASVKEIWNGAASREFLMEMLKKGRHACNKTCAACEYPCYDAVDDIDPYAERILKKFEARGRAK